MQSKGQTLGVGVATSPIASAADVVREGIVSGLLGAVSIAVWFLITDSLQGRPFHTPSVFGTALFMVLGEGASLPDPSAVPVSAGVVFFFSVLHGLTFIGVGLIGAFLLGLAESDAENALFPVLLFVTIGMWFTFLSMVVAGVILKALTVVDITIAHLLASLAMGLYYRSRHPALRERVEGR